MGTVIHAAMNRILFITFAALLGLTSSRADAVYSTYGPDPYTPYFNSHGVGWLFLPGSPGGGRAVASSFTLTSSSYVNSVTLDVLHIYENAPNLELAIYPDNGGLPGLTPLTSVEPRPTGTLLNQKQSIEYSFAFRALLEANQQYWFVMQPSTFDTDTENHNAFYFVSGSGVSSFPSPLIRDYNGSVGWSDWTTYSTYMPAPVFSLNGSAVPEPSTWALLGLGSALFWCAARRRRK